MKHEKRHDIKRGLTQNTEKEYKQIVRALTMAMTFLLSSNKIIIGSILDKLRDAYSFSKDVYLKTLISVYKLLVIHAESQKPQQK